MLTTMFNNNKKPFYTLATNYELKPIGKDVFYSYIVERLDKKNIKVSIGDFEYIYDISDGETRIIQKIFYELFEKYENKEIIKDDIEDIIEMLNMQNDSVYRLLCDNLTKNQVTTLKIIAQNSTEILSKDILVKYKISAASIQSSLNSLLKKELVYKNENRYIIYDKEFDFWLDR
jgi:predicted transcriptional regulator